MMAQTVMGGSLVVLLGVVGYLAWAGRRLMTSREDLESIPNKAISVLIPVYNNAKKTEKTVDSLLSSIPAGSEIMLLDDGSASLEHVVLQATADRYEAVSLCTNPVNKGKVSTLQCWFRQAKHDTLMFVDADVVVSQKAVQEMLAALRLSGVTAVNAPYRPSSQGWWAMMQWMEYAMVAMVLWAYNKKSAMMLLGSCFAIKKQALESVGGFSVEAIAEDMDLGFRLYQKGFRIVTTATAIQTDVPLRWSVWWRQKIRWGMGGLQCLVRYVNVWIRHPIQLFFLVTYTCFTVMGLFGFSYALIFWSNLFLHTTPFEFIRVGFELYEGGFVRYGIEFLRNLAWMFGFTLVSLPYVFPFVRSWKTIGKALYVVPYAIVYVPLVSAAHVWGAWLLLRRWQRNALGVRAKWS